MTFSEGTKHRAEDVVRAERRIPELPPLDSPEVAAQHAKMKRRMKRGRVWTYAAAVVIGLWILLPLFFVFSMAFTTVENGTKGSTFLG